jgi:hypothetical protein
MKLTELKPRFFKEPDQEGVVGLTFLCPHCQTTRLGVHFNDVGHTLIGVHEPEAVRAQPGVEVWTLTGTSFEDLSLTPSVDASATGHWHGFVTQGSVV